MGENKYWLGQSDWSASRLEYQFGLIKNNFDGDILDPSIPLNRSDLLIADVCTGTGTWVLELAEKVPETVKIEGLDINLDLLPQQSWMPDNVSFRVFNLLKDIPEDLVGRYDIIHIQLIMVFVLDHSFQDVFNKLLKMLKPGGYIQWTETNSNKYSWITASGDTNPPEARKLYEMVSEVLRSEERKWLDNFCSEFQEAGLESVKYVEAKTKPSTLRPMMMNWIWLLREAFAMIAINYPDKKPLVDEASVQSDKVIEEARRLKVGMNMRIIRCVGRKSFF